MSALATIDVRHHACSSFYHLLIILTIALIPSTLNSHFAYGVFASASAAAAADATTTTNTATSQPERIAVKSDQNVLSMIDEFDSHAAASAAVLVASSADSLLMATSSSSSSSPSSAADSSHDLAQLAFEPNLLNFDELSIGETSNRIVTIFNRHANRSVYLGSISGSVADFYSSFFEEHLVPPLGNTTFNVVFLPRQQAMVQSNLVIHTSFGVLNYLVKGKGTECPYRLSPLIGLKAPMNATLTPEIHMYNPFDTPMQILEVYSSGGQFQLELPTSTAKSGSQAATTSIDENRDTNDSGSGRALWEIPPYCSKPIIRVRFTATTAGNHTAYIRIKVSTRNNAALENAVIVLPIEVEIFKEPGIYSNVPFLNFGLGGTNDRPKNILFKLLNSGKEQLEIDAYTVEADVDVKNGVALEMDTVHDPDANETYQTITATVDWPKIRVEREFRGNIVITTKPKTAGSSGSSSNNNNINNINIGDADDDDVDDDDDYEDEMPKRVYRIPFVGGILRGSIQYNESLTRFHIANKPLTATDDRSATRDFRLKNNFDIALAVTNLTVPTDCHRFFRIENFQPKILAPGDESTLFQLVQLSAATRKSVTRYLQLHTNVSTYDIEVLSFSGMLRRLLPITEQTSIKAKDIDAAIDEKTIDFGILPLATMSYTMMAFVNQNPITIDIQNWKGTISSAAHIGITVPGCSRLSMKGLKFCNNVKPGEWIVFRVGVTSNTVGTFEGKITVKTDYEEINTPIRFSTDMGILKFTTKMINKDDCFPGGLCTVNLTAHSTFMRTMVVENIHADAIGIHYEYDSEKPVISAQTESNIGQLKIVMPRICNEKCSLRTTANDELHSALIGKEKSELFANIMESFRAMHRRFSKISFHIRTNHIKRYDFNGSIDLMWPKLVDGPIDFPVTQVGHELIKFINVFNPSNETIMVYYSIHDANENGIEVELPPEVINECWNCFLTPESVFSLAEPELETQPIAHIPAYTTAQVPVKFSAQTAGNYATLFYIQSNFTILEAIWLTAKAVMPQFKFGNRKPGSKTPLLFELTDKHLRDCNHPNVNMRAVSAKRTFTAKNSGEVPITLRAIRIDNLPCEGYGFRIADCVPFELPPNGSKKIEISFTPDFTLAMVKKTLYIETSLNYSVNYTLLSMIAPLSLGVCSKALARPEWESIMKNITAVVLAFSFFCVLLAAYLDSMKVLKNHMQTMSKTKGSLQPALDLRQIGLKSLFSDDTSKANATSTAANNSKQPAANGLHSGKGQVCKKRGADKKRGSFNAESAASKKSWASEIAKKFTPKKSEVKASPAVPTVASTSKETTPNKPKSSPPPQSTEKSNNKRDKKAKDDAASNINLEEEDSSSTTTENSNHSDEKSLTKDKPTKKSTTLKEPTPAAVPSKDRKMSVKKSKSLPLNYETAEADNLPPTLTSAASKPIKDTEKSSPSNDLNNRKTNGTQNDEETTKRVDTPKEFSTPPSTTKSTYVKSANGKTPGRERSRINTGENIAAPKKLPNALDSSMTLTNSSSTAFKGTAFEFSSPLSDSPTTGTHPLWDLRKISFSSIVQTPKLDQSSSSSSSASPPLSTATDATSSTKSSSKSAAKQHQQKANTEFNHLLLNSSSKPRLDSSSVKPSERKSAISKFSAVNANADAFSRARSPFDALAGDAVKKSTSQAVDLGPIGTRKSPSSTPIWEPMHSIHSPIPLPPSHSQNQLVNSNPNSFFSGTFPHQMPASSFSRNMNNFMHPSHQFQQQQQSMRQLDYQRRQMQQQQHQSQQQMASPPAQQLRRDSITDRVTHSITSTDSITDQQLWDSALLLNMLQRQKQLQQAQNAIPSTSASQMQGMYSQTNSLWNLSNPFETTAVLNRPSDSFWSTSNTASTSSNSNHYEVRPPPGLAHIARDKNRELLYRQHQIRQYLQHQQRQQQQQQQQLQQQQQQQQPQPQQQPLPPQQQQDSNELPPYDPFNALSSIWSSDNWSS